MSFRDFKEEVFLVLEIKEGHGFGFATNPLLITANLAGNVHESFVVEHSPQPKFENVFVWVMDKNKLKSIWSDKVPVRVECHSVLQSQRTRVGYLILNVKDAQIVKEESNIVEKQSRLLGLSKEGSISKPELIFSFFITDNPINSPKLIPQFWPPLEGKAVHMGEEPLRVTVGAGRDHFILTITVVAVNNLRELLPSQSDVEPELLTYTYSLLGAEIVSDSATSHSVRLRLTSSLACLKTYYLREPSVPVQLSMGSLYVGDTTINLQDLLLSDEVASGRRGKERCRTMSCRCVVTPTHSTSQSLVETASRPSVDFSITLGCELPVVKKKSVGSLAAPTNSAGPGGDADRVRCVPLQTPLTLPLSSHSCNTPRSTPRGGETYRTEPSTTSHTVQVTVTSLRTEQTLPPDCWLRLTHPSASVSPASSVALPSTLSALQWQLTLTLPPHLLESTLSAHPPCLQLGSAADQLIATTLLQVPHNLTNGGETLSVLERDGERVGEVGVMWKCGNESSQSVITHTETSLSPPTQTQTRTSYVVAGGDVPLSPRSRELKILSFVEELEDWAEKQRIMVMEGLKEEEATRLAALQSQWESEVGGQVVEGRQLVEALQTMRDRLRRQETDMREREHKLKMYKEDLDRVHRNKLQEFKDLSRRMQDEFNHKLTLMAGDKVALEKEVDQLREQNAKLKQSLQEIETKADENQELLESVIHDQKVLKEKLEVEQESKKFFKEHCRKAEQEIHRLHTLRQEELAARLNMDKKNLEQLAFQHIISERQELRQDQDLLEEIRQQLLRGTDQSDLSFNSNREHVVFPAERHVRRAT